MVTGTTGSEDKEVKIDYWHVIDEQLDSKPEDWTTTSATYDPSKIKLDVFHFHEMMDRIHTINCSINDQLLEHPVTAKYKSLYNKIEKATDLLAEAYRMAGNLNFKSEKPIYTQKQVDAILSKHGILSGKNAKTFYDNIVNPKALAPEVKERMRNLFNSVQRNNNIE